MWHVQLSSNPTISKLLEQLNDHIPLEGENCGLEDYVVELHDYDGTDFECLHYQLVRSVLKPDDRVFIRSLDRDDHRRRRVSGRLQISSDGRHLIDGVPFGRPRLRAPMGRPSTYIPPRKRPRLTYSPQDDEDSDQHPGIESSALALSLANQELDEIDDLGDGDLDADYIDYASDDEPGISSNESRVEDESDDESNDESEQDAREQSRVQDESEQDTGEPDDNEEGGGLDQEARDLAVENAVLDGANPPQVQTISLATLDKLTALHTAFPMAPIDLCEKVLAASKDDLKTTYNVLSEGFYPQMSQEAVVAWKPGRGNPDGNSEQSRTLLNSASTQGLTGERPMKKRKLKDQPSFEDTDSDEDEDSLVRKYVLDHAGFPPGTITSGTGLTQMATISASFGTSKINGNSEATTTTLKALADERIDEDDDTSSSGSSSDSTTSSDGSDDTSDEEVSNPDLPNSSSSDSSDDSDSDSNDESSERPRHADNNDHASSSPANRSDGDSDSDSDSGPEEYPTSRNGPTATDKKPSNSDGLDDASDSESTGTDSSSASEEDTDDEFHPKEVDVPNSFMAAQTRSQAHPSSPKLVHIKATPISVPPGAGKESTKRRNARRRAAKLAKKGIHGPNDHNTNPTIAESIATAGEDTHVDEAALFKAKRKALLEAIAAGGIEVGPSGETSLDKSFIETDGIKRKRTEEKDITPQHNNHDGKVETISNSRWDPQQQNFSTSKRNKRGGHSKRAQRNQSQYYENDSRPARKRKQDDSYNLTNSDQDGDNDKEPDNVTSQVTDLDDLPSLPKATSWQPQLSRVTAIVTTVDDNAMVLKVCLAKRDRYLDGNEKRYDFRTGQRIYDKFEAPDLDEDEEADDDHDNIGMDEGYRDVPWIQGFYNNH
ncbi:hypothetical protein ONZ43_g5622 [Nemania bipapillata]|uniref:Uncharacterized protein n=1 Tax=Nemania bipapillata TaxID=110536 RepID=A0ACC2I8C8_9PEZI|nr:hypothetical protein ONZ43_g5622 [Nemania bipapillata]